MCTIVKKFREYEWWLRRQSSDLSWKTWHPHYVTECLERNQTLTTPPLQKTINESEDVRNHLFDQEVDNTSEFRQESIVKRPESGILPPVLPYKSFSATKRIQNSSSSPKTNTRKSILQRSKTINVPESNGTSTYHDQVGIVFDLNWEVNWLERCTKGYHKRVIFP